MLQNIPSLSNKEIYVFHFYGKMNKMNKIRNPIRNKSPGRQSSDLVRNKKRKNRSISSDSPFENEQGKKMIPSGEFVDATSLTETSIGTVEGGKDSAHGGGKMEKRCRCMLWKTRINRTRIKKPLVDFEESFFYRKIHVKRKIIVNYNILKHVKI